MHTLQSHIGNARAPRGVLEPCAILPANVLDVQSVLPSEASGSLIRRHAAHALANSIQRFVRARWAGRMRVGNRKRVRIGVRVWGHASGDRSGLQLVVIIILWQNS